VVSGEWSETVAGLSLNLNLNLNPEDSKFEEERQGKIGKKILDRFVDIVYIEITSPGDA